MDKTDAMGRCYIDLGGKQYRVVEDSLPAFCFKVLSEEEEAEYCMWAVRHILSFSLFEAVPVSGLWHPVIQDWLLAVQEKEIV